MNIVQEQIDDQSALLKVKLEPQDYSQQYDSALKNYRRQVNLPGFRQGKVPMGLVKNRYGKAVLADELNKLLNQSIQQYIAENKLRVLGSPIPSEQHEETGDWDNPSDFEFYYELGFAPHMDVKLDSKDKLIYHTIAVDDKMLNDHIKDVTFRFGDVVEEEQIQDESIVEGQLVELEPDGEVKPGGLFEALRFKVAAQPEEFKQSLYGKKVDDKITADPRSLVVDAKNLEKQLMLEPHELEMRMHPHYQFSIQTIRRMKTPEINQDLFDKMFGEGVVNSEEEFRDKMRQDMSSNFVRESKTLFKRDVTRYFIKKLDPTLPDAFLKRYIRLTNDKPVTAEEIEHDYDEYKRAMQWQLIFNELLNIGYIRVGNEEVVNRAKTLLAAQYAQYGIPAPDDAELEASARRILAKEDQAKGILDNLYDEKLEAYVRDSASVEEKEVSFDDFVQLAGS